MLVTLPAGRVTCTARNVRYGLHLLCGCSMLLSLPVVLLLASCGAKTGGGLCSVNGKLVSTHGASDRVCVASFGFKPGRCDFVERSLAVGVVAVAVCFLFASVRTVFKVALFSKNTPGAHLAMCLNSPSVHTDSQPFLYGLWLSRVAGFVVLSRVLPVNSCRPPRFAHVLLSLFVTNLSGIVTRMASNAHRTLVLVHMFYSTYVLGGMKRSLVGCHWAVSGGDWLRVGEGAVSGSFLDSFVSRPGLLPPPHLQPKIISGGSKMLRFVRWFLWCVLVAGLVLVALSVYSSVIY